MQSKRKGQGDRGRCPGEVAEAETGRLPLSQPGRQLGEEHSPFLWFSDLYLVCVLG